MSYKVPMLARLLSIIGAILFCYYFPSDYQDAVLGFDKLKENTAHSLYLCLFVSVMWMERSALCIIIIEAFLICCNFYVAYHYHTGTGIFATHYGDIQMGAFLLELLIMVIFTTLELRKIGRSDGVPDFHSHVLRRRRAHGDIN